ncbi:MAG: DUF4290 domain-containing protein [Cytophagaceae bacterium]|nr:DUF4290 domain-containing protein [Cytophagaceae bacterium]
MKEYGSSVQKLVDYIMTVEDRQTRTKYAHLLVELMRQVHPNMKDNQDYYNKLWDDLYIMSNFRLDVDSPYPPPSPEAVGRKPKPVPYNTHNLRFRHYGRNLELMVTKAIGVENEMERRAFVSYIAKMMKSFYASWNKDNTDDTVIFDQLRELSKGQLNDDIEYIKANGYLDVAPRDRYSSGPQTSNRQPGQVHGGNESRGQGGNTQRRFGNTDDRRSDDRRPNNNPGDDRRRNNPNNRNNRNNRKK